MKPFLSALTMLTCLLGLVSLVQAQEAPPASPASPAASTLQGRWTLTGSVRSSEARRDVAIERVTDQMNVFVRGIAGRRLRRGMPIPQAIVIEGEGASFRAKVGDFDLRFAADGARHSMVDPFGNDIRASHRLEGTRLRQVMRSDGGTLTHVLQLSEDGERLTLTVRVSSSQLPADVVYRAHFRRR